MENHTYRKNKIKKVFGNLTEKEKKTFLKTIGIKDIHEFNKIDFDKILVKCLSACL